MTDTKKLTYPNGIYDVAMARRAHEAKKPMPPMPKLREPPAELKTAEARRAWQIQASREWDEAKRAEGYR